MRRNAANLAVIILSRLAAVGATTPPFPASTLRVLVSLGLVVLGLVRGLEESPDRGRLASTAATISRATALAAGGLVVARLGDRIGHVRILWVCALGMTLLYLPMGVGL